MTSDLAEALALLRNARCELSTPLAESRAWFERRDALLAKYPEPPKLLPCPFCGNCNIERGAALSVSHSGHEHWTRCMKCGTGGPVLNSEDAATAAWNRRVAP